ncbi:helix-turn-helix transcriptional regulator [Alkalihalophilus pseudofirmus]|jgi:DNA-directed RNA polymerase specialized sigma subunit|uniref:Helix-turn-helix transcriptional regulator n=1 Tax=Alkalihalophilus pseudofirmus TaxID=79885 RepID=A0AAJ2NPT1_ALKPS|nr:helix-turn-helix transcriptional regulator [Alkalihalophilus pseudofirmus]MDV2886360.1 helix-turn-helix transcriptional regulator [Alkalihalophilus pseudofirmus]
MIKTEPAYRKALEKLKEDNVFIEKQKKTLQEMGLTGEQVEKALQPAISFHEQLKEEVAYYERIKRGEFDTMINLHQLGKTLIAYRIYTGLSQQELAARLGVSPSQVSRDERNEYYGATLERLQQVMEAMRMVSKTEIQSGDLLLA